MLEIRKSTFSKSYENSFFRDFSRHLFNAFKERNINGLLLGSPFCEAEERLQIDALLITKNVVCIIDFKNFSGEINLPAEGNFEHGLWTDGNGEPIKGGNSTNPFVQLKLQRTRFYDVCQKHIIKNLSQGDLFNPGRTIRIVCFQGEIKLNGIIPGSESNTFSILDRVTFLEKILDIVDVTDKSVNLSEASYGAFKRVFQSDLFKIDDRPLEDKLKEIANKSTRLNYNTLFEDQKATLAEIKIFLESEEEKVFILQGTTNSGKSYLIPFIQEIAFNSGREQAEVFAASSRVANNLILTDETIKVHSLYSYIYGGNKSLTYDSGNDSTEEAESISKKDEPLPVNLEIVPIKKCDDSDSAVYIIDESQLVSDSLYHSIDLIFGTGHLLHDLIDFAEISSTKRKFIFIGDPYQLHVGKLQESPLNPSYLAEQYKLNTVCFQLLDKDNYSNTTKAALICAKSIREHKFNSLKFEISPDVDILPREKFKDFVESCFNNNLNVHYLYFSNEEALKANLWIKKYVLRNGDELSKGDLLLINNNFSVEDETDPNARPKKIHNGQFGLVIKVTDELIREVPLPDSNPIDFREIEIQLSDTGNKMKVLSLENYRLNAKGEISKEELRAYSVLLKRLLDKEFNFMDSEELRKVASTKEFLDIGGFSNEFISKLIKDGRTATKTEAEKTLKKIINAARNHYRNTLESKLRQDPSTKYFKYKNAALLRYGWAMTVHKSMSYKWNEIVFNVYPGESIGINNEMHFRWLYTGLSRAKSKIKLVNYQPINPFDKCEFVDANTSAKPKDIFFISDAESLEERLSHFTEFMRNKINSIGYLIKRIDNLKYQLTILIEGKKAELATISVYYKDNGNFNMPTLMKTEPKEFGSEVIAKLKLRIPIQDFSFIKDAWREREYASVSKQLSKEDVFFELIIQHKYKDLVKIYSETDELEVEIIYDGSGMVGKVTAKYYSNPIIWESFKNSIHSI